MTDDAEKQRVSSDGSLKSGEEPKKKADLGFFSNYKVCYAFSDADLTDETDQYTRESSLLPTQSHGYSSLLAAVRPPAQVSRFH